MGMTVVARPDRPSIMQAHAEVLAHVEARRTESAAALAEMQRGVEHTQRGTFGSTALEKAMGRERRRLTFLEKVAAALRAGYTIMPNLNLTLLAVRTDRGAPGQMVERNYRGRPAELDVPAMALPAGEGVYVSPEPNLESWPEGRGEPGSKDARQVIVYRTTGHAPVDVPVALVRDDLAGPLQAALEEPLFDELGIVQDNAKRDPLLVGRILHPKARGYDRRGVAFFLGWWFDPRTLD